MVDKRSAWTFIVALVFFAGSNAGTFPGLGVPLKLASNCLAGYCLLELMYQVLRERKLYKCSPIVILYALYVILYMLFTEIKGGELIFHNITSLLKSVIQMIWISQRIEEDEDDALYSILLAFYFWCIFDIVITFLYPLGAPFLANGYILGWKNNKILPYFIANFLSLYVYVRKRECGSNKNFLLIWFGFALASAISSIMAGSSTTAFVIVMMLAYIPLKGLIDATFITNINAILIIHVIIFILVIFVRETFQEPLDAIMMALFQKDATFTGRIYIWKNAFVKIVQSPIIGYGKYSMNWAALPGGYYYPWNMAHNQILDLLMQGGVVFLSIWFSVLNKIRKAALHNSTQYGKIVAYSMFSLLFFYLTEASVGDTSFFVMTLFYYVATRKEYYEE